VTDHLTPRRIDGRPGTIGELDADRQRLVAYRRELVAYRRELASDRREPQR
jgi:hypothetical protein